MFHMERGLTRALARAYGRGMDCKQCGTPTDATHGYCTPCYIKRNSPRAENGDLVISQTLIGRISDPVNEIRALKLATQDGQWEAQIEFTYGVYLSGGVSSTPDGAIRNLVMQMHCRAQRLGPMVEA